MATMGFPCRLESGLGRFRRLSELEEIKQSVHLILTTRRGERLKLGRLVKLILAFSTQILFVILPNRANSPLYGFIFFYFLIGYSLTGLLPLYKKWVGHYIKNTVVALWIICIFFYQRENYIYTSQLSVNNIYNSPLKQLEVNVFRWVTGIVGSFSFMKICNRYIKKFSPGILALFSYMGKNTIYIYT